MKNEKTRVTVCCARKSDTGYGWRLHALLMTHTNGFSIKTFNSVHTCGGDIRAQESIEKIGIIYPSDYTEVSTNNNALMNLFLQFMTALAVARNGRPRMMGV